MSDAVPTLQAVYDYLKKIDGDITDFRNAVNLRFESIELRLDKLDARSQLISDKIDEVALEVLNVKAELRGIKRRLDELEMHSAPTERVK